MSLQSLQSRLSSLQAREQELKRKLQRAKDRLREVNAVTKSLINVADDNYSGINQCNTAVTEGFRESISGPATQEATMSQLQADREAGHSQDLNLSDAVEQLRVEKRNLENQIDELESQLATCRSDISSTKNAIARERERLRAEERRRREAERKKASQAVK